MDMICRWHYVVQLDHCWRHSKFPGMDLFSPLVDRALFNALLHFFLQSALNAICTFVSNSEKCGNFSERWTQHALIWSAAFAQPPSVVICIALCVPKAIETLIGIEKACAFFPICFRRSAETVLCRVTAICNWWELFGICEPQKLRWWRLLVATKTVRWLNCHSQFRHGVRALSMLEGKI